MCDPDHDILTRLSADHVCVVAAVFDETVMGTVASANSRCPGFPERVSSIGIRPIHAAAMGGKSGTVAMLLSECDVSPESKDDYGRTALHCVFSAALLMESERRPVVTGLDMEYRSRALLDSLRRSASRSADAELARLCRRKFPGCRFGVENDLADVAVELLDRGACVDAPDDEGRTPYQLLIAAFYMAGRYQRELARRVFERINVFHRDPWGMTPLMHAASVGDEDSVEALLGRGADPMARCRDEHRTALHYAVLSKSSAIGVLSRCTCLMSIDKRWLRPLDVAVSVNAPSSVLKMLGVRTA
jgi:hypothetical protein